MSYTVPLSSISRIHISTTIGRVVLWALTSVVRSQLNTFFILRRSGWQSLGTSLEHCLCTFSPQSGERHQGGRVTAQCWDDTAIISASLTRVVKDNDDELPCQRAQPAPSFHHRLFQYATVMVENSAYASRVVILAVCQCCRLSHREGVGQLVREHTSVRECLLVWYHRL